MPMVPSRIFQHNKDLVIALTQKELKIRYKRNILGYLWSVGSPLAQALVFFIAFKVIMKVDIKNYTLFLISGLFPWQWFSNSINCAPMILVGNASLIKKVNFAREVLVVAAVLNDMLHFVLSIPVIMVFMFFYGITPTLSWFIYVPLLLIMQFALTFGVAVAVSAVNLFFRDMERIVSILTSLMFYTIPIIYSADMVPARFRPLIMLNPLSVLVLSWRSLFMDGAVDPLSIGLSFTFSLLVLAAGYAVFRRLRWRFAEVL
jgi:lipopolysaccharide transport system permease protein